LEIVLHKRSWLEYCTRICLCLKHENSKVRIVSLLNEIRTGHQANRILKSVTQTPILEFRLCQCTRLATGWEIERSGFESGQCQELSLLHIVQTGSGVHPSSYTICTGALSAGVKRQAREADHSPPSSAEGKIHSPCILMA
jgi:hypothetical protein